MFIEKLKEKFGINKPIFLEEIINEFPQYSRVYIFKLLHNAENENRIKKFSRGVYYFSENRWFGETTISAESVAIKKYIEDGNNRFGVLSGLTSLNYFSITNQVPQTHEFVTNKESTRKRTVNICGMRYVIRKSRTTITNENYAAYTILQLLSNISEVREINDFARSEIAKFIQMNKVSKKQLIEMSKSFPNNTIRKLINSEVLDYAI